MVLPDRKKKAHSSSVISVLSIDKWKELIQESGYRGQEVIIITGSSGRIRVNIAKHSGKEYCIVGGARSNAIYAS